MSVAINAEGFKVEDVPNDGNGLYKTLTMLKGDGKINLYKYDDLYVARLVIKGEEPELPKASLSEDDIITFVNRVAETLKTLNLLADILGV